MAKSLAKFITILCIAYLAFYFLFGATGFRDTYAKSLVKRWNKSRIEFAPHFAAEYKFIPNQSTEKVKAKLFNVKELQATINKGQAEGKTSFEIPDAYYFVNVDLFSLVCYALLFSLCLATPVRRVDKFKMIGLGFILLQLVFLFKFYITTYHYFYYYEKLNYNEWGSFGESIFTYLFQLIRRVGFSYVAPFLIWIAILGLSGLLRIKFTDPLLNFNSIDRE